MTKNSKISMFILLLIGTFSTFFGVDDKKEKDTKTRISSKNFNYIIAKGEAVYTGDVVVLDPQIDIFTDLMTVYFAKGKNKKKDRPKPAPNLPANGENGVRKKNAPKGALAPMGGIGGNIERIVCEGNVILVNKKDKVTATGDKAVYTATNEIMVITGNAKLQTKDGVLRGKVIVYDRLTGDLSAMQADSELNSKKKNKEPLAPKAPKGK